MNAQATSASSTRPLFREAAAAPHVTASNGHISRVSSPSDLSVGLVQWGGLPPAPQSVEATGLSLTFLGELVVKCMALQGHTRLLEIAQHLCLPATVVEQVCVFLRRESLIEILRRGNTESDVIYDLTLAGRARASEWAARNAYSGAAPVPLADYVARVQAQSVSGLKVTAKEVQAAFSDMVMPPQLRDQLGTAFNSARPMLVYGPPGSGKTYMAERLQRLLGGAIVVPHAVLVHGEVVRVFDAQCHHRVTLDDGAHIGLGGSGLDGRQRHDARWLLCERPVVACGGELTLETLELSFDPRAGFYEAPPHFKANNGLFIVDDLGRQVISPAQLMNRWIVPMERRIDHLALRNGGKFTAPFDLVLVFSSNLRPIDLGDTAFLRRIGHKIEIGPLMLEDFSRVFVDVCAAEQLPFDQQVYDGHLLPWLKAHNKPLLACYPRDLVRLMCSRASYQGHAPRMDVDMLNWACEAYFGAPTSGAVNPVIR